MTATNKNKNIPELRFPDFEGEWEKKRIKEIGKFFGGGTPESSKTNYWKGETPWVSSSDIKENNIHNIDITRYITEEAIKNSATKIIPENSLLIVSRVGIGKFAVAKQKLCTSQDFTSLITNSDNTYFLAYYFCARKNRFLSLSQGTSIKGFTGQDIGNLKFNIPTHPEQQKITTFLTAVDKRIHLLTQKKENLEQYKKGVMQKLFSRELRFRDENGNDYPKWEEKRLGDVSFINMGQSPSSTSYNSIGNGVPLIQGNADITKRESSPRQWTTKPTKMCDSGDLLLTVRAPVGTIAKCINNACIGRGICSIRNKKNSILEYLYQYLLYFESKWSNIEQGSTFTAVSRKDVESVKFYLPSLPEQQKIASFLSAIDKQIEKVARQIEHSNQWKKGLLQKMFV